ncbi:MAG TPA: dienelactone hydrolase family protein [Vicinamibacteria bacterium]
MGERVRLRASDGHELSAYRAEPSKRPRGGVVVLQEIFGVNSHIRAVTDGFAAEGYLALAPALYDRSSVKDVEMGYTKDDIARGRDLREEFSWDDTVKDVEAAMNALRREGLRVGTVGYCWGGSISFLSAVRLPLEAAVVYYGGQILPYLNEKERCPLLMHFGKRDASIPPSDVAAIQKAHPEAIVHVYDADHGFNCDQRPQYDEASARLAGERTLAFFAVNLAS